MAPTLANKEMGESHPMNSGDGPNSYAQNSSYQRGVIDAAKGVIFQGITEKLDIIKNPNSIFRIADLGCSTGPNTFIAMQNIVEAVEHKHKSIQKQLPEFQVFFNDHTENDFNILFRSLPQYNSKHDYFVAGVPGSFYTRVFPKASLHIVHCSYALHWLSKVPKEVQDKSCLAWNKGRIHYTGVEKEVAVAYFGQFKNDMDAFLNARAQELVGGGLVAIQIPGVPNGSLFSQTGAGMLHALLGSCLMDLANMGVINEERVDSCNLPQYHPSIEELEMVIEMNNNFSIESIETLSHPMKHLPFDVKMTSTQVRAIMEGLIKECFGDEIVDHLFDLFTKKLADNYFIFDKEISKDVDIFVLLKRNCY